ncbi:MAG: hypothetical protein Q7U91_07560 [Sideroxyarcus sp.]|nr:hypothetical protein [Sideroxyarcus sp.]
MPLMLLPLFSLTNKTPEQLFAIAEGGPAGFYPVGTNRFWHGGIHLHGNEPVRAMWDGEIVAYRVSNLKLSATLEDREQTFSHSFVLLRHTYETPKGAQIKFHSLYMHLLPIGEYSAAQLAKAPSIFHQKRYTVALDTDFGLSICDLVNSNTVLGYIPNGSPFEVIIDPAMHGEWRHVSFNGIEGCVDTGRARARQARPAANSYTATLTSANANAAERGTNLRNAASKGKVVDFAPKGKVLHFKEQAVHDKGFLKTPAYRELEPGGVFVHTTAQSVSAKDVVEPIQWDSVINLETPLPVKAGELLGYTGPYCRREAVAHVEVFTDNIGLLDNPKQETWGAKEGEINAYTWPDFKRIEDPSGFSQDGFVDVVALVAQLDTDHDGDISIDEIKAALRNADTAKQLRHLVCRHPTEWSATGLETKFARLQGVPWKLKEAQYQQQLTHIKQLTFWEQVTQKPASSTVWHLHPVAFIAHLKGLRGITKEQLRAIMPGITDENIEKYLMPLNETMEKYGINENRLRQCHFLAQVAVETGGLMYAIEKGNKSASRNVNLENATTYYCDIEDTYFQQYIGNIGNVRSKIANEADDPSRKDAVKFRGRGLLHLTGRANYAKYWVYRGWLDEKTFKKYWWDNNDEKAAVIDNPQQISINAVDACDSSGWYWTMGSGRGNGNIIADTGDSEDVVKKITRLVNGGANGLAERKQAFISAKTELIGN